MGRSPATFGRPLSPSHHNHNTVSALHKDDERNNQPLPLSLFATTNKCSRSREGTHTCPRIVIHMHAIVFIWGAFCDLLCVFGVCYLCRHFYVRMHITEEHQQEYSKEESATRRGSSCLVVLVFLFFFLLLFVVLVIFFFQEGENPARVKEEANAV